MRAFLKNHRHAPRKMRLIAKAVIGKDVSVALPELSMMPHKGATTLHKLISSALANAKDQDTSVHERDLTIKNITVDKGMTFVRYMPRAFGRATPLRKECSHIRVTLEPKGGKPIAEKDSATKGTSKKQTSKKADTKKKGVKTKTSASDTTSTEKKETEKKKTKPAKKAETAKIDKKETVTK
jgi:large subunit ribosomal protein L22